MVSFRSLSNVIRPFFFYGVFGVLTTLVNVITYWAASRLLGMGTMTSTIVAWTIAVLFAFLTNRRWVFQSNVDSKIGLFLEIGRFFIARLATGLFDWLCMYLCVELLGLDDIIIKILANILVIIANFLASNFIVFSGLKK